MVEDNNGCRVAKMEIGHSVPRCVLQEHLFNFVWVTIGLLKVVLLVDGAEESNIVEGDVAEGEFTFDVAGVAGYSDCGALKVSLDLRRADMGSLAL